MTDRRAFVKQLSGAGIISAIPDVLLSQSKSQTPKTKFAQR
jgi:hypothetical protein